MTSYCLWVKLRRCCYSSSITGLYRFLRKKNFIPVKLANPKHIVKLYEKMPYHSRHIQIDVKFITSLYLVNELKCSVISIPSLMSIPDGILQRLTKDASSLYTSALSSQFLRIQRIRRANTENFCRLLYGSLCLRETKYGRRIFSFVKVTTSFSICCSH